MAEDRRERRTNRIEDKREREKNRIEDKKEWVKYCEELSRTISSANYEKNENEEELEDKKEEISLIKGETLAEKVELSEEIEKNENKEDLRNEKMEGEVNKETGHIGGINKKARIFTRTQMRRMKWRKMKHGRKSNFERRYNNNYCKRKKNKINTNMITSSKMVSDGNDVPRSAIWKDEIKDEEDMPSNKVIWYFEKEELGYKKKKIKKKWFGEKKRTFKKEDVMENKMKVILEKWQYRRSRWRVANLIKYEK